MALSVGESVGDRLSFVRAALANQLLVDEGNCDGDGDDGDETDE